MPSKTSKKKASVELPRIPKEVIDQLVSGPMTAEAVNAASMAFKKVFLEAKPALLEPIVRMEITVPQKNVGDINSDIASRRGRVLGMDSTGGDYQTIIAEVPLAEVTTYARSLSSITGGQGSYTMEFCRYDIVPSNLAKEIIEKAQRKVEEEEE